MGTLTRRSSIQRAIRLISVAGTSAASLVLGVRGACGLKLPLRGGAVWKLSDGDLKYADITITDLEYNIAR